MLASLVANILALAGVMFSMQVYDRVPVPAKSFNTLYVLFIGVLMAVFFDFIMRRLRHPHHRHHRQAHRHANLPI